jgi:cellulose synthase (UDP-forming)
MVILLAADLYTFLILLLGFFQSVAPLNRRPVLLPDNAEEWPRVDVLIPTYNESIDVVRYTVLAALQMDWPQDKLRVILLDDGGRSEFRAFAEQVGADYIARTEHSGAKAGNLNNALRQTRGEFVTIFDCDHIPTRSFLQISLGWFLRDEKLGMVQTPHHFYSPDPFERNLGKFRKMPSEGSLFYGIVQDANDLWNATYFCGSCAVLRRTALDGVGGIAQETVTEDAHTSLRLQKAGWNTAYINLPQSAGLATETLARHVKQRVRWARGMVQMLRIDNPLLARGLKLSQRLCYFNATLHFLYALPRLVFLTAPLLYLFFGLSNVPGYWLTILAFAGPHLALSTMVNSRIQGGKRFSFWNEIYETVLAPYILLPTFVALVNPHSGSFNVTDKGGAQERGYFSARLALPFLILLVLNLAGLALAFPRYLYWDQGHAGTIGMNVFWCLFNIVILAVTLSVCVEERQRRHSVRINCAVPVVLKANGEVAAGMTSDLSTGGVAAKVGVSWPMGEEVKIQFPEESQTEWISGTVLGCQGGHLRVEFGELCLAEQRLLTSALYSRADRWLEWDENIGADKPLFSLFSVLWAAVSGFWKLLIVIPRGFSGEPAKPLKPIRTGVIGLLVLTALGLAVWRANASTTHARKESKAPASETIERSFTLGSLNLTERGFLLDQPGSREILKFATPQSWLIQGGRLHLKFQVPKNARQVYTYADIRLNDSVLASITPTPEERDAGVGEVVVPLPPELLLAKNELIIQLAGQGNTACATPSQRQVPWLRIDPASTVTLAAQPLAVASEMSALPQPFLEHLANAPVVLPFVFLHAPDDVTLQTAGVMASWFGSLADDSGVRFSSRVGELPAGNAVLFVVGAEDMGFEAPGAAANGASDASVSLQENPKDRYGKLLVVHGRTSEDLLAVAQAFATGQMKLASSVARMSEPLSLPVRQPNDAPRWIRSNRVGLFDLVGRAERRTYGQNPINVYMHLAPDFNFGVQHNMYAHLDYSVESGELSRASNVTATLNGAPLGSVPMSGKAAEQTVDIPMVDVPAAVYANTLQLQFYFVPAGADPCAPDPRHSSAQLLGGSYLDLGSAVHFTELPNLQLFAKAGFPFTRMADLSQTVVLLPAAAGTEVTDLYLDLMGYFGVQTGYPTTGVEIESLANASRYHDKDLLLLGTYANLTDVPEITSSLPMTYGAGEFTLSRRASVALLTDWFAQRNSDAWKMFHDALPTTPDGVIEGIASPFGNGRSVVVLAARDRASLPTLTSALLTTMPRDGIDGTVSVWTAGSFVSYPLATAMFGSGELPWYRSFAYWLPHHLYVLLSLIVLVFALLGWWTERWITRLKHERLLMSPVREVGGPGRSTGPQRAASHG